MLITILIWLYIALLTIPYGAGFVWLFDRGISNIQTGNLRRLTVVMVTGLCLISAIANLISLVLPLALTANLILMIGGIGIAFALRSTIAQLFANRRESPAIATVMAGLLIAAFGLVTLAKTVGQPLNYDTGLYHAGAIRWAETYPAVPGLGNLESRLAFNSSWMQLSALFSFSFADLGSLHVLNGFLFLLVNIWFIQKSIDLLRGRYTLSNLSAPVLIYLSRRLFSLELSSVGTDLPAAILTWVVFLLAIDKLETGSRRDLDADLGIIWLISSAAVTIKLSAAPVLLLPLYITFTAFTRQSGKRILALMAVLAVGFLPWLARNIIFSGYLLYPLASIDLFSPDWKIPARYVEQTASAVTTWARLPGMPQSEVLALPLMGWLPTWLAAQTDLSHILLAVSAIGCLLVGISAAIDFMRRQSRPQIILPLAVAWIGMIYWFISAPDMRFSYGFLGLICALCAAVIASRLIPYSGRLVRPAALIVILTLLLYQGYSLYKMRDLSAINGYWVVPANYPAVRTEARKLGDFFANMPVEGNQCWYAVLPCTANHNPEVRMRGDDLRDGFCNRDFCRK